MTKERAPKAPGCPSCKGPVRPRVDNPDFPFCSQRCKAIDLSRWFTGSYAVPGERVEGVLDRDDDHEGKKGQ